MSASATIFYYKIHQIITSLFIDMLRSYIHKNLILTADLAVKKNLKCSLQLNIGCLVTLVIKTFNAFILSNIKSLEYLSN